MNLLSSKKYKDALASAYCELMERLQNQAFFRLNNDLTQIFTNYGPIKCWNCENCQFKGYCPYPWVEKVYKSLKERYAASNIKQDDTNELLLFWGKGDGVMGSIGLNRISAHPPAGS